MKTFIFLIFKETDKKIKIYGRIESKTKSIIDISNELSINSRKGENQLIYEFGENFFDKAEMFFDIMKEIKLVDVRNINELYIQLLNNFRNISEIKTQILVKGEK